jgi:CO/xanthine dehydrogenase Mo-binding subunit
METKVLDNDLAGGDACHGVQETTVIGKRRPKIDAWHKAKGTTIYADDFTMPGMLHAKVLRSAYPAAMILAIDTSQAEALPGVHAVLTCKDVPNNNLRAKFGQSTDVGSNFEGLYRVLAENKVRFMGEAVALVAAETLKIAEDALNLIKVDYEPLAGVFDPVEALKPGAYLVGEGESNLVSQFKIRKGDVEAGFAAADVIVENTYRVPYHDHAYLEPESGVAWVDENEVVNIRVSTQVIEHFRTVAEVLGLPQNQVRVIGTWLGGGFGGKEDITVESFLALLALKTRRPVKLTYTREESFLAHGKRHPYVMKYKTGATRDGRLVAVEAELVSDAGAYTYLTPWILLYSTVNAAGPYDIPNVKVDAASALTNNLLTSANRGFGAVQPNVAYESQIDQIARILGMDPLAIRQKNCLRQGGSLATGFKFDRYVGVADAAEKAWLALGPTPESHDKNIRIGHGLAVGMMSYGRLTFLHDSSRCFIKLELDGSAVVRCGVQDLGGGQASTLCEIVCEELGIPMEKIKIYIADTALTPLAGTTTATRMLYMSGNATLKAARELKQRLLTRAEAMLDVCAADLKIADGRIASTTDPDRHVAMKEVIDACAAEGIELFHEAQFNAPFTEVPMSETITGQTHPDFTFGCHAVEVAVDVETGFVEVRKLIACYDVGKALNVLNVEGQLEGGAIYNMGYALTEDLIVEKGYLKTPSFSEYLIATSVDAPDVEPIMIESGAGLGPYGAKGVGEPADNSIAPAILNAIYDAVGVRITTMPATPERVFWAMQEQQQKSHQ